MTLDKDPPSQMIRVPTPLVNAIRELSRLHRAGRTKAVLEGLEGLIAAIDSEIDVDIDSVSDAISKLMQRVDKLEMKASASNTDIDIDSVAKSISKLAERLDKVESDIEAMAVGQSGASALTIRDLRKSQPVAGSDINADIEVSAPQQPASDIKPDSGVTAGLPPNTPHTQIALAKRFGCSDVAIGKHRRQGAAHFSQWSSDRDPTGIAWQARKVGKQIRYFPIPKR